jgi:hypothetical protein
VKESQRDEDCQGVAIDLEQVNEGYFESSFVLEDQIGNERVEEERQSDEETYLKEFADTIIGKFSYHILVHVLLSSIVRVILLRYLALKLERSYHVTKDAKFNDQRYCNPKWSIQLELPSAVLALLILVISHHLGIVFYQVMLVLRDKWPNGIDKLVLDFFCCRIKVSLILQRIKEPSLYEALVFLKVCRRNAVSLVVLFLLHPLLGLIDVAP